MRRRDKSEISEPKKSRTPEQVATADAAAPTGGEAALVLSYSQLLDELHRAVDDQYARSPHLVVFEEFHMDDPERADLLSGKAAELFEQIRQQDPRDPLALHHLAVIHHGLGYRLHLDKTSAGGAAILHWKKGVEAWAELVRDDGFWDALRARWQRHRDKNPHDMLAQRLLQVDLNAFRRHIPNYILNLHVAIVREYFPTDLQVAKAHLGVILESGFEVAAIESARKRLFEDLVGNIQDMCKALKFAEARDRVERYLRIDGDHVAAICSALWICCAECKHLGVGGQEVERRLQLLQACEPHAAHRLLRQQAEHDLWAAESLRDFYLQGALAELHRGRGLKNNLRPRNAAFERALERSNQAVAFERCGQEARKLRGVIYWDGARGDIHSPDTDFGLARRLLDDGLANSPNDAELRAVNAEYYWNYGDERRFREELARAERCNEIDSSQDASRLIADLQECLQSGACLPREVRRLQHKALESLQAGNARQALTHLASIKRAYPNLTADAAFELCYLEIVCHLKLDQIPQAINTAMRARPHMGPNTPPEARELIDNLCRAAAQMGR
jgi:hypothetical protein